MLFQLRENMALVFTLWNDTCKITPTATRKNKSTYLLYHISLYYRHACGAFPTFSVSVKLIPLLGICWRCSQSRWWWGASSGILTRAPLMQRSTQGTTCLFYSWLLIRTQVDQTATPFLMWKALWWGINIMPCIYASACPSAGRTLGRRFSLPVRPPANGQRKILTRNTFKKEPLSREILTQIGSISQSDKVGYYMFHTDTFMYHNLHSAIPETSISYWHHPSCFSQVHILTYLVPDNSISLRIKRELVTRLRFQQHPGKRLVLQQNMNIKWWKENSLSLSPSLSICGWHQH